MTRPDPLVPLVRSYIETEPGAAARAFETMSEGEAAEAMNQLPPTVAARTFPHLQSGYAAAILSEASPALFEAVSKAMQPDRVAQVYTRMTTDARERLVSLLPPKVRAHVQALLTYPEHSVGQVMVGRFLAFRGDLTVRETVARFRAESKSQFRHSYAYIVDAEGRLEGVMGTYDLLTAAPGQLVRDLMRRDVFTLDPFTDQQAAAAELGKRRYFAAPVVDANGLLLGVVKAEQLLAGVKSDVASDMQKMFGAGGEERVFSSIRFSLSKRLPWLHVNLLTAFAAAAVVSLFEGIIAQVTALAVFLPVVAGQGGNAGAQSLAIVMRGLVMREIPRDRIRRLILKEGLLGIVNGAVTGLVTSLVAWLWMGNPWLGLVIGLGMIVNLTCAGLAGAAIPLGMKRLGLDPAQSSSIVLTTVTDIVGFFAFLGFAVIFKSYLL